MILTLVDRENDMVYIKYELIYCIKMLNQLSNSLLQLFDVVYLEDCQAQQK